VHSVVAVAVQHQVHTVAAQQPAQVTGEGVIDLAVWRQHHSMTVHLVNLTNPMMMKGPMRSVMPTGAQVVRLRTPDGATPDRVHLLVAAEDAEFRTAGEDLVIAVPRIHEHEVVAIDFA